MVERIEDRPEGAAVGAERDARHEHGCAICHAETRPAGTVYGRYSGRHYELERCGSCGFAFVAEPLTDFAALYDDAYYDGRGADPLVDYGFELSHPDETIRGYEWRGVARVVEALMGDMSTLRWLDYGCGNGGLVRHLRRHHGVDACGFEEGAIVEQARQLEIPVRTRAELEDGARFDVVTAIEVLEHTIDPVAELRRMRQLLRPGGLLFLTTGNARPHATSLADWSYVIPEIHVSFFEPRTIARAMELAGFQPEHRDLGPGFDDILTFKVLKNLRLRRRSALTDRLPRRPVGIVAERLAHLREHPVGWAKEGDVGEDC